MTCDEAEARQALAKCYHIFASKGWDEGIYNHITLRIKGEDAFLINPFGLLYKEVTPHNLIRVGLDGSHDGPVNQAGLLQHCALHNAGANAVIHTHTTATMAVCSIKCGLQPINFNAAFLAGDIAYHPFEGVTVREDEMPRLIRNMGDKRILLMKNHGPIVIGNTIQEAFLRYMTLQRACEVQIATLSMGVATEVISPEVQRQHQAHSHVVSDQSGVLDFDAAYRNI